MNFFQSLSRVGNQGGLLHEVVYGQGREETGRASGRKDVVGTCEVVPERLGGILAQEDGSGIPDIGHVREGVLRHDFQVFGSNFVHTVEGRLLVFRNQDVAEILQRFFNNCFSFQSRYKGVNFLLYLFCHFFRSRHQNGRSHLVVLGLGQEVCRHVAGISRLIAEHHDFGRTGHGIDGNRTEHGLFRQGHEDIARAHNLVHLRNRLCAKGHGCNGLGSADLEDPVRPGLRCGNQSRSSHLALFVAGGAHDDIGYPGHLGRNDIHEDGRRIDGLAAGHIDTGPLHGNDPLAQENALFGCKPGLLDLLLVEGADPDQGFTDDGKKLRRNLGIGFLNLLFGHLNIGSGKSSPVKFLRIGKKGTVPVFLHVFYYGLDCGLPLIVGSGFSLL